MRKFLISILAILYITTSTGATMNVHYCMDKLADWELGHNTTKNCSKCGMAEKKDGCCRDEQQFIKNQPDQKITEVSFQFIKIISVALPPLCFTEMGINNFTSVKEKNSRSNAPPRTCGVAVYIRNCAFLI